MRITEAVRMVTTARRQKRVHSLRPTFGEREGGEENGDDGGGKGSGWPSFYRQRRDGGGSVMRSMWWGRAAAWACATGTRGGGHDRGWATGERDGSNVAPVAAPLVGMVPVSGAVSPGAGRWRVAGGRESSGMLWLGGREEMLLSLG